MIHIIPSKERYKGHCTSQGCHYVPQVSISRTGLQPALYCCHCYPVLFPVKQFHLIVSLDSQDAAELRIERRGGIIGKQHYGMKKGHVIIAYSVPVGL